MVKPSSSEAIPWILLSLQKPEQKNLEKWLGENVNFEGKSVKSNSIDRKGK